MAHLATFYSKQPTTAIRRENKSHIFGFSLQIIKIEQISPNWNSYWDEIHRKPLHGPQSIFPHYPTIICWDLATTPGWDTSESVGCLQKVKLLLYIFLSVLQWGCGQQTRQIRGNHSRDCVWFSQQKAEARHSVICLSVDVEPVWCPQRSRCFLITIITSKSSRDSLWWGSDPS